MHSHSSTLCLCSDYCASKFAAVGFAESVALELLATKKNGVKTTIVCPFFINTGMFDGAITKWVHRSDIHTHTQNTFCYHELC